MAPNDALTFDFTPNQPALSTLHLKNIASHNVSFKVKTTAPKTYQVKPSQGILQKNESVTINLTMHTQESEPDTSKDKFLVEATTTQLSVREGLSQVITEEIKNCPKELVQRAKLYVALNPTRFVNRAGTVYANAVEPAKGSKVDETNKHIEELESFIKQINEENNVMEKKLEAIQGNLKKKQSSAKAWSAETLRGFTVLHAIMVFVSGVMFGFLSAENNHSKKS